MTAVASPSQTADAGLPIIADIDEVTRYWDRRPCNVRHSRLEVGTAEYFAEVEQRRYFVEPHIPRFAQFERWAGKRVLEIGCGIGTDAVCFARAGADYAGVELSNASLDLAQRRFNTLGLRGAFHLCNAEHLADVVRPQSFDLVYSFGVIHHTPDQRAVVASARSVIRDNGELRIMLYAQQSWKAMMIEAGLDQPEAQFGCPIATLYTPEMVAELFDGLFAVVSIEQTHIFPYRIADYVQYHYVVEPWFKQMPPAMFEALQRRLGWHLLIAARPI